MERGVPRARLHSATRYPYALRPTLVWAGGLAAIWWLLCPADRATWIVGVPVIALATGLAMALRGPQRLQLALLALPRFAAYFAWESLRSGWDIAWRAFRPGLPLAPALVLHRTRLPDGPATTLLAGVTSLFPGSVSVDVAGRTLRIHVLDCGQPVSLAALEAHIAALCGVELLPPAEDADE